MRGATATFSIMASRSVFQSTLLMRGATNHTAFLRGHSRFQSTLLMRGATSSLSSSSYMHGFQSTLLMRGATEAHALHTRGFQFQSTLLMRGATHPKCFWQRTCFISIHAPHARSDLRPLKLRLTSSNFNPRSSCEERLHCEACEADPELFQSTLLMRGATSSVDLLLPGSRISIHAPHARSDLTTTSSLSSQNHFNPRSSCEERLCRL